MKTLLTHVNSPQPDCGHKVARWQLGVLVLAAALLVLPCATPAFAQQAAPAPSSTQSSTTPNYDTECVIGLKGVKHHANGNLLVGKDALHFVMAKGESTISFASIQDIFTGGDSKQVFSGPGGTLLKMGVPYEGGRVLSLFSTATEVLTIEYRDADGGYHGAVFILPKGQATVTKKQLVEKGAKASIPPQEPGKEEKK
jgi:hypothetical protein